MRRDTPRHRLVLMLIVLAVTGCGDGGNRFAMGAWQYRTGDFQQWALPKPLREVSGLALDPQGRLFAHDDERARIYQIDYLEGLVVKRFDVGNPVLRDDFEGIAWAQDRLFLVTSDGTLFAAPEGEEGSSVTFQRYDTGLGERCEIEGLYYEAADDVLWMPCKTLRDPALSGRIVVLSWSLREEGPGPDLLIAAPDNQKFHPSGLTRCARSGHLVLVAARQSALLEVTGEGELRQFVVLPEARHRQMEGVEMTANGDLIIADEGGRLGVYAAQR